MVIREFIESDRQALSEIYLRARELAFPWLNSSTFSENDFDRDTKGEEVLVGELGSSAIGFVSTMHSTRFIHNLYIRPEHLRKGYGERLLTEALKRVEKPATLKCQALNHNALEFYKSTGWIEVGTGQSDIGEYFIMENSDFT